MAGIHFNIKTGKRGKCTAQPGKCPVCDEQHHFATEEEVNKYEDCLVNPIEDEDALLQASNAELTGTIDHYEKQYKELEEYFDNEIKYEEEAAKLKTEAFEDFQKLKKDYSNKETTLATLEILKSNVAPICEKRALGEYQINKTFQENYILDDLDVSERTEIELAKLISKNKNDVKELTPEDVSNIKEVADNPDLLNQLNQRIKDVQRTSNVISRYNARLREIDKECEVLDGYMQTGIKGYYVDDSISKIFEDIDKKRAGLNSKLEELANKYKTPLSTDVKPTFSGLRKITNKLNEAKRIRELRNKES